MQQFIQINSVEIIHGRSHDALAPDFFFFFFFFFFLKKKNMFYLAPRGQHERRGGDSDGTGESARG